MNIEKVFVLTKRRTEEEAVQKGLNVIAILLHFGGRVTVAKNRDIDAIVRGAAVEDCLEGLS
jgi:hypothetical protein